MSSSAPLNDDWIDKVLTFWFSELTPKQWFSSSDELDATISERFGVLLRTLRTSTSSELAATPEGALAAIIVLDQFSRNIFRGQGEAFAQDEFAAELAEAAVSAGFDEKLTAQQRHFMYMPFMHAEHMERQERALELFGAMQDEGTLKFARDHYDVIARFGRYPYRNKVLGRTSTPDELEYLKDAKTYGQ